MKKLFGLLVIVLGLSTLSSNAQTWTTDYQAALKESKKTNKAILMNFTGSDWCGWCIRLKNEVFSKEEFIAYANENLILLELDFPKRKKLEADLKLQNNKLAGTHAVRGFPTIVMIDGNEKVLLKGGYKKGGPIPYIATLKQAFAKASSN
jgi:thioredoxin-related protein